MSEHIVEILILAGLVVSNLLWWRAMDKRPTHTAVVMARTSSYYSGYGDAKLEYGRNCAKCCDDIGEKEEQENVKKKKIEKIDGCPCFVSCTDGQDSGKCEGLQDDNTCSDSDHCETLAHWQNSMEEKE